MYNREESFLYPFGIRKEQELGILDVLVELNDDTKINIEIQVKGRVCLKIHSRRLHAPLRGILGPNSVNVARYTSFIWPQSPTKWDAQPAESNFQTHSGKDWDKRQLFYLAKIYTADLANAEQYLRLKRCVGICILDFNLTDRPEYHSIYRLTDAEGHVYSDMIEIHTLELRKKLREGDPVNDWIRLFNAESVEDLQMIKTRNPGIAEAIREVMSMSLSKKLRILYDAYLIDKMDQKAMDAYVREEGYNAGKAQGLEEGKAEGKAQEAERGIRIFILDNLEEGKTKQQIIHKLVRSYQLSEEKAEEYFHRYGGGNN